MKNEVLERLNTELLNLTENQTKLSSFLDKIEDGSISVDVLEGANEQLALMIEQEDLMIELKRVLTERINLFN